MSEEALKGREMDLAASQRVVYRPETEVTGKGGGEAASCTAGLMGNLAILCFLLDSRRNCPKAFASHAPYGTATRDSRE